MTSMNERSITIADALDWTQAVFADQVRQLLASDYLSILDLDRVLYAMGDFRIAMDLPAHLGKESVHYAGLRALHCVHFNEIDPEVRIGIPVAVIQTLGLTDHEASRMLGAERWDQLKVDLHSWVERFAAPAAATPAARNSEDEDALKIAEVPQISVMRFRKWPWIAGGALIVAAVVVVANLGGPARPSSRTAVPSYLQDGMVPLSPLQPVSSSRQPSPMEECVDQGGTCTSMESTQPAAALRQLAAAMPTKKGQRYRIGLSVVPVEEPDAEQ